jgi:hypothetical protein
MKTTITINIGIKAFDLPKMAIPQIGSTIFMENMIGIVKNVNYHINNKHLDMITIFADEQ